MKGLAGGPSIVQPAFMLHLVICANMDLVHKLFQISLGLFGDIS